MNKRSFLPTSRAISGVIAAGHELLGREPLASDTFGNPGSAITNTATVGRITSAGGNRTVQLGAKLQF